MIAACAVLAGLGHLYFSLGEDRYRFERETLAQIEEAPWARVVDAAEWGDIIAPRTWFDTPVGFFRVASPDIAGGWSDEEPTLQVTILRYKEKPQVGLADVACEDREARWAYPDRGGTFRYEAGGMQKLTEREYEVFCKTDWREAIDQMMDEASRE